MTEFVTAVNANNEKQEIPREWLDHPVFGQGFKLPPSSREQQADRPDDTWKVPELRAFADKRGIDITGLSLKADLLEAVTADPPTAPGDDPGDGDDASETPES